MAIPPGWAGFVLPRSGLALHQGLTVLNAPGLIDSGYRGEIKVLLINHGEQVVTIGRGDRIAQLVIQPVPKSRWSTFRTCRPASGGPAASAAQEASALTGGGGGA